MGWGVGGEVSVEELGGYRYLWVFTSEYEAKIRVAQVRKWSRNKIYSWSGKLRE